MATAMNATLMMDDGHTDPMVQLLLGAEQDLHGMGWSHPPQLLVIELAPIPDTAASYGYAIAAVPVPLDWWRALDDRTRPDPVAMLRGLAAAMPGGVVPLPNNGRSFLGVATATIGVGLPKTDDPVKAAEYDAATLDGSIMNHPDGRRTRILTAIFRTAQDGDPRVVQVLRAQGQTPPTVINSGIGAHSNTPTWPLIVALAELCDFVHDRIAREGATPPPRPLGYGR